MTIPTRPHSGARRVTLWPGRRTIGERSPGAELRAQTGQIARATGRPGLSLGAAQFRDQRFLTPVRQAVQVIQRTEVSAQSDRRQTEQTQTGQPVTILMRHAPQDDRGETEDADLHGEAGKNRGLRSPLAPEGRKLNSFWRIE